VLRETRELSLRQGINEVELEGLCPRLIPWSLALHAEGLQELQWRLRYRFPNQDVFLVELEGQQVSITQPSGEWSIQHFPDPEPDRIGQRGDRERRQARQELHEALNVLLKRLRVPDDYPGDGPPPPELDLTLRLLSARSGQVPIRLYCLCFGLEWEAEYHLRPEPEHSRIQLGGWLVLRNRSGMSFQDVSLHLAGGMPAPPAFESRQAQGSAEGLLGSMVDARHVPNRRLRCGPADYVLLTAAPPSSTSLDLPPGESLRPLLEAREHAARYTYSHPARHGEPGDAAVELNFAMDSSSVDRFPRRSRLRVLDNPFRAAVRHPRQLRFTPGFQPYDIHLGVDPALRVTLSDSTFQAAGAQRRLLCYEFCNEHNYPLILDLSHSLGRNWRSLGEHRFIRRVGDELKGRVGLGPRENRELRLVLESRQPKARIGLHEDGWALIEEQRPVELHKGLNRIELDQLSLGILPWSTKFEVPGAVLRRLEFRYAAEHGDTLKVSLSGDRLRAWPVRGDTIDLVLPEGVRLSSEVLKRRYPRQQDPENSTPGILNRDTPLGKVFDAVSSPGPRTMLSPKEFEEFSWKDYDRSAIEATRRSRGLCRVLATLDSSSDGEREGRLSMITDRWNVLQSRVGRPSGDWGRLQVHEQLIVQNSSGLEWPAARLELLEGRPCREFVLLDRPAPSCWDGVSDEEQGLPPHPCAGILDWDADDFRRRFLSLPDDGEGLSLGRTVLPPSNVTRELPVELVFEYPARHRAEGLSCCLRLLDDDGLLDASPVAAAGGTSFDPEKLYVEVPEAVLDSLGLVRGKGNRFSFDAEGKAWIGRDELIRVERRTGSEQREGPGRTYWVELNLENLRQDQSREVVVVERQRNTDWRIEFCEPACRRSDERTVEITVHLEPGGASRARLELRTQ